MDPSGHKSKVPWRQRRSAQTSSFHRRPPNKAYIVYAWLSFFHRVFYVSGFCNVINMASSLRLQQTTEMLLLFSNENLWWFTRRVRDSVEKILFWSRAVMAPWVMCVWCLVFLSLSLLYTHDFRKKPYIRWSRCRAHGSKKSLLLFCFQLFASPAVISKIGKSQCKPRPDSLSSLPFPSIYIYGIAAKSFVLFSSWIVDVFSLFLVLTHFPLFFLFLFFSLMCEAEKHAVKKI